MDKVKVLVDAMRDGIDLKLNNLGYDAHSVKKFVDEGGKFKSDFSVLNHARENHMVLVTEDTENIKGCKENNMEYVVFGQNHTFEYLVAELEKIRQRRVKSNDVSS